MSCARAERIGITEQNVSRLKSGQERGIRFDTLARICTVRDCAPGDILTFEPDAEEAATRDATP